MCIYMIQFLSNTEHILIQNSIIIIDIKESQISHPHRNGWNSCWNPLIFMKQILRIPKVPNDRYTIYKDIHVVE